MSKIIQINELQGLRSRNGNKKNWTAIIPAAGVGSRLGYKKPKILYPILGRPILAHLIDLLGPYVDSFVFILNPTGVSLIKPRLEKLIPSRYTIAIQNEPTGMADAVQLGVDLVASENCLIVWGDQITLNKMTIEKCMSLHEASEEPDFTCPTILKKDPYIHFDRISNQLMFVKHRREKDAMPSTGENDCGIFFFKTEPLKSVLKEESQNPIVFGRMTKERNFLSYLPSFDRPPMKSVTLRIQDETETLGINTKKEAEAVEKILKART